MIYTKDYSFQRLEEKRKITNFEKFFYQFNVSNIVFFKRTENFDLQKYLQNLGEALNLFWYFFAQVQDDFIVWSKDSKIRIETQDLSERSSEKIEDLLYMPIAQPTQDSAMVSFRLTYTKEHFVIGTCFNHMIIDHGTFLNFLGYVADLYNGTEGGKPTLDLLNPAQIQCESRDFLASPASALEFANQVGRIHQSQASFEKKVEISLHPSQWLQLELSKNQLKKLQTEWSTQEIRVSANDILNGLICILAAHDPVLNKIGTVQCEFPMNVRKLLKLSETTLGNCLAMVYVSQEALAGPAAKSDLAETARVIKRQVLKTDPNQLKKLIAWYETLGDRNDHFSNYTSRFMQNSLVIQTTSWVGFDYAKIQPKGTSFYKISQPSGGFFRHYLAPILPKYVEDDERYCMKFSTYSKMNDFLRSLLDRYQLENYSIPNLNLEPR